MEYIVKFISVEAHVRSNTQPVYLMDYDGTYVYHTLTTSVNASELEGALTDNSEKVRIPVFAYKTGKEPESGLFAVGMQIGMQALEAYKAANPHSKSEIRPVIVLGVERHDLSEQEEPEEAYRVYAGISFARTK